VLISSLPTSSDNDREKLVKSSSSDQYIRVPISIGRTTSETALQLYRTAAVTDIRNQEFLNRKVCCLLDKEEFCVCVFFFCTVQFDITVQHKPMNAQFSN